METVITLGVIGAGSRQGKIGAIPLSHAIWTNITDTQRCSRVKPQLKSLWEHKIYTLDCSRLAGILDSTPFTPPFTRTNMATLAPLLNLSKFGQIHFTHQRGTSRSPHATEPSHAVSGCMEAATAGWARPAKAHSTHTSMNSVSLRSSAEHREHHVQMVKIIKAVENLAHTRPPHHQSTVPEPRNSLCSDTSSLESLAEHVVNHSARAVR